MSEHRFKSREDFIRAVNENKAEYDKKRLLLSWEEKLKVLVKLQQKAYAAGKLGIKPWPIKDK